MPKREYRVVEIDTDLEQHLNALAGEGFEVDQMTDQHVVLVRTSDTTESERRTQTEKSTRNSAGQRAPKSA